jgi:hypothetical protein
MFFVFCSDIALKKWGKKFQKPDDDENKNEKLRRRISDGACCQVS